MKKTLILILFALLCAASVASAEEAVYVLMNIPYADFYGGENAIDAITSATLKGKARNTNVTGASYHQSEEAVTTEGIAGATYPVKAALSDLEALGGLEITDESALTYIFSAKGTDTEVNLTGVDVLLESPNYAYYILSEEPASYKEMSIVDGAPVFSGVIGTASAGTASGVVSYTGHHTDIEISLDGIEADPAVVSGVIVTMDDGTSYAMHHIVNIWRGELGWDRADLDLGGQTITGLRYLLKDGSIQDYAVEIEILPAFEGVITGFVNADLDTFVLNGSLEDLADAELTVVCTVGTAKGAPSDTVFSGAATNDPVELDTDMIAELKAAGEADAEAIISATISSSNYATIVVPVE